MDSNECYEEKRMLQALEKKDKKALRLFNKKYRDNLIIFTYFLVRDIDIATKTVNELFDRLWQESEFKHIDPPIYQFLLTEIRRICMH